MLDTTLRAPRRRRAVLLLAAAGAVLTSPAAAFAARAPQAGLVPAAEAVLVPSDPEPNLDFGWAVDVSGDTAVVGAYRDSHSVGGTLAGSAYVYERSGSVWGGEQKLIAGDAQPSDGFGLSVAVDGDTLLVGANHDSYFGLGNAGSAYVFVRQGKAWVQQAQLFAPDPHADDSFGVAVALDGDTAVVGAPGIDLGAISNVGAAYVFVRESGAWSLQAQLFTSAPGARGLGRAVSVDGDTVAASGLAFHPTLLSVEGSVHVFVRSAGLWSEQATLQPADAQPADHFGGGVDLSGDTLIVGAELHDHSGLSRAGAAYVYARVVGSWGEEQKLVASDGASIDLFGAGVAVEGDLAVVGALLDDHSGELDAGSAYAFARSGTGWSEVAWIRSLAPQQSESLGRDVALSGATVVAGAENHDVPLASSSGAAFAFRLLDCAVDLPAGEVVRLGSPPNPLALLPGGTGGPVIGSAWNPRIDHTTFQPGAVRDFLALSTHALEASTPFGTLLFDLGAPALFLTAVAGAPFELELPAECGLVGLQLVAQGASLDQASMALTNALDVTLGSF